MPGAAARSARTAGQSSSVMANIAVSRGRPSSPGASDGRWWRSVPSKRAPMRSMARRLRSLRTSVASATRRHAPHVEGVDEQQQLGLGVDRRALGVGGEPGAADLDLVGFLATAPPPQLHEPGAPDEAAVGRRGAGRTGPPSPASRWASRRPM